jgi:hypothetical protein
VLSDHVKLERLFTARNIERVADIQVIWTSNLADHLQLEDDDTKVRLFSHALSWSCNDSGKLQASWLPVSQCSNAPNVLTSKTVFD